MWKVRTPSSDQQLETYFENSGDSDYLDGGLGNGFIARSLLKAA